MYQLVQATVRNALERAQKQQNMALWRSWLARRPVTAEVAGSSPVRVAETFGFLAR